MIIDTSKLDEEANRIADQRYSRATSVDEMALMLKSDWKKLEKFARRAGIGVRKHNPPYDGPNPYRDARLNDPFRLYRIEANKSSEVGGSEARS